IYEFYRGMRVNDLVAQAGGVKDDAYLEKAELARTQVLNGAQTHHTYMDVDLRGALGGQKDQNPTLEPNDEILIKAASNYHLPWTVVINGGVLRWGTYTIREGERMASLLARCGGFLPNAFPRGIVFTRRSVKAIEQERLDDARAQLQQSVAQ